jgi:hypothetical protein
LLRGEVAVETLRTVGLPNAVLREHERDQERVPEAGSPLSEGKPLLTMDHSDRHTHEVDEERDLAFREIGLAHHLLS